MKKRRDSGEESKHEVDALRRRVAELEAAAKEHETIRAALQQSEAKFRKLTEKSVVGVYVIQDGMLTYVNPKFAKMFGYKVHEMVNKMEARAVVLPKDWPRNKYYMEQRISGKYDAVNFQFRGVKKDGEVIEVEAYGSRMENEGRPAVIGSLVDITERMRTKRELERQVSKFQVLYNLALAMTAERSLDENLNLFVETSRELLGTDTAFFAMRDEEAGELYWHSKSGLVTPAFRDLRIPLGVGLAGSVAQSGERIVVEDYFREIGPALHEVTRDEGLISGIAIPVMMGGLNLGVLLAFNRRKTQFQESDLNTLSLLANIAAVEVSRKRYQEGLRKSEESYRRLYGKSKRGEELYSSFLNSSADAILIVDLKGKTRYLSPSFSRIFGWSLKEVKGKPVPFVPDSEEESGRALREKVLVAGIPIVGLETRRKRKDGSLLDVSISAAPYHDQKGVPAGMSIILRDVTPFKSIERARRRAVSHLSHELMTPLAVLEASAQQMSRKGQPQKAKEKSLKRILRNIERLKDLQEVVQEIAVPRTYEPTAFDIETTIHRIVEDILENSSHRSVALTSNLEPVRTDSIDPEVFAIILSTLLKNAIENTPDEGAVSISLTTHDSGVLLRVEDTGIGIAPADRDFIFEGFHHTQATDRYSTRKPFDFNAGGKGLELMRLKILSEEGWFDISFESKRCRFLPTRSDQCPGRISSCPHVKNLKGCRQAGGTTFSVLFHSRTS